MLSLCLLATRLKQNTQLRTYVHLNESPWEPMPGNDQNKSQSPQMTASTLNLMLHSNWAQSRSFIIVKCKPIFPVITYTHLKSHVAL